MTSVSLPFQEIGGLSFQLLHHLSSFDSGPRSIPRTIQTTPDITTTTPVSTIISQCSFPREATATVITMAPTSDVPAPYRFFRRTFRSPWAKKRRAIRTDPIRCSAPIVCPARLIHRLVGNSCGTPSATYFCDGTSQTRTVWSLPGKLNGQVCFNRL